MQAACLGYPLGLSFQLPRHPVRIRDPWNHEVPKIAGCVPWRRGGHTRSWLQGLGGRTMKEKEGRRGDFTQKGDTCFPGDVSGDRMEILSAIVLNVSFNLSFLLQAWARLDCWVQRKMEKIKKRLYTRDPRKSLYCAYFTWCCLRKWANQILQPWFSENQRGWSWIGISIWGNVGFSFEKMDWLCTMDLLNFIAWLPTVWMVLCALPGAGHWRGPTGAE